MRHVGKYIYCKRQALPFPHCPLAPVHWLPTQVSCHVFDPEWHPIVVMSPTRLTQAPSGGVKSLQPNTVNSIDASFYRGRLLERLRCFITKTYIGSSMYDSYIVNTPENSRINSASPLSWLVNSTMTSLPVDVITSALRLPVSSCATFPEVTSRRRPKFRGVAMLKLQSVTLMRWPALADIVSCCCCCGCGDSHNVNNWSLVIRVLWEVRGILGWGLVQNSWVNSRTENIAKI